jgi:phospholipase C
VGARLLKALAPRSFARLANADSGPATYDRYGFRIPAVIISPCARPDFVLSDVLDHTSVLRLVAFLTPPDLPAPKDGPFHVS